MKLKVLGSGNISAKDNSSSFIIDDTILIDIPNGAYKNLKNIGFEPYNVTDLLITHFHADHYFDVPFLLLDKIFNDGDLVNIWCDKTGEDKIYNLMKLAFPNIIDKLPQYFKYNTDRIFKIKNYKVEKVHVEHEEGIESNALIFTENDVKVGFTGDSGLCKEIYLLAEKCNHLIIDCTAMKGKKSHIGVNEIQELADKFPDCVFYTTHMGNGVRENLNRLNIKNIIPLQDNDEFIF